MTGIMVVGVVILVVALFRMNFLDIIGPQRKGDATEAWDVRVEKVEEVDTDLHLPGDVSDLGNKPEDEDVEYEV